MVKPINLESLLQANKSLNAAAFYKFLDHYGIDLKDYEIKDLDNLTSNLRKSGCAVNNLSNFFVGYKIPQISKEFDLLRFGQKNIINIELKNEATVEKIKKQLLRNKYYLSFIGKEILAFTFVSKTNELYFLNNNENLEKIEFTELASSVADQAIDDIFDPNKLFNPSDFLVSPFNSTDKFLREEYFLTHQQEETKNQIITAINTATKSEFFSIMGSAGTGKTLLTYDIVKHLIKTNKKPLIIHCGLLNDGHQLLIEKGWEITSIKYYKKYDFKKFDLVVVDESQRIYPPQLDAIIAKVENSKCICIFSHDKLQTLSKHEKNSDLCSKILAIPRIKEFRLSEKIRTNKEISSFIKMLFSKNWSGTLLSNENIEINYFNLSQDAKDYLDGLNKNQWTVLRFTPSLFNNEHHEEYSNDENTTSHKVIGQEFDGVAVTIDKFFSYAENGELIYRGNAYYDPPKMLFQNITRARKRLNLVIIGNEELLNRCFTILQ